MKKPQTIGHYWRLKRDWEIMSREAKKRANELDNALYTWGRAQILQYPPQHRHEMANKARELELDLARLQGKVTKLQNVLEAFEESLPKKVPIEIDGGKTDGR